jgi:hypothetical protein
MNFEKSPVFYISGWLGVTEWQLHRQRIRIGYRIGDARHIDLFGYVAWLVELRHAPQSPRNEADYKTHKERSRARKVALTLTGRDIGEMPAVADP